MIVEKKHNYFYKVINKINGKFYYGIHSTDNLEDGYMGGGTALRHAQRKYGIDNFEKEIIADYRSRSEASDHERRIVTPKLIESKNCYNLQSGGLNAHIPSVETKQKISAAVAGEKNGFYGKTHTEETKKKISNSLSGENHPQFGKLGKDSHNYGKKHTEETKKKWRDMRSGKNHPLFGVTGKDHPNYGFRHSEETKKKMSDAKSGGKCYMFGRTGEKNPRARKCSVNGKSFLTIKFAAEFYKIDNRTAGYRISSNSPKWADWKYLE